METLCSWAGNRLWGKRGTGEQVKKTVKIIKLDPVRPEAAFSRCREVISAGGVIAYPTDTFYGLGADPKNLRAVQKLFEIKGRPTVQPILLLVADPQDARQWAADIPPQADELMKRCWPGPLTLILKARADVLPELTAGTGTIGLRVPGNQLTRDLLCFLGCALTGTSANRSGQTSFCTARETADAIGDRVDLILDGGATAGGKPSTIVDVRTGFPRVVREGAVPLQDISVEEKSRQ
jgi:L-threonylcarbamoyladenylate synthase